MLKLLFKDLLRSPGKLLAMCFVVYLASISFFVGCFLAFAALGWLRKTLIAKAKALEAAEAEAAREYADKVREQAKAAVASRQAETDVAPASGAAVVIPMTPKRRYAKSAVVVPFKKTGTKD
ncbi:conserved hypothetical protein [Paraburkholderia unamae]|uniref:hypothetical protein n=1 Tax=Paraburkholderia unamae TaxID=219649 RepID=UPI001CADB716|nr:hypothetical protein [Paraburkholderia unamae]CAG9255192.1 conserved hypothetical protein [Paraburkholderia unamae]